MAENRQQLLKAPDESGLAVDDSASGAHVASSNRVVTTRAARSDESEHILALDAYPPIKAWQKMPRVSADYEYSNLAHPDNELMNESEQNRNYHQRLSDGTGRLRRRATPNRTKDSRNTSLPQSLFIGDETSQQNRHRALERIHSRFNATTDAQHPWSEEDFRHANNGTRSYDVRCLNGQWFEERAWREPNFIEPLGRFLPGKFRRVTEYAEQFRNRGDGLVASDDGDPYVKRRRLLRLGHPMPLLMTQHDGLDRLERADHLNTTSFAQIGRRPSECQLDERSFRLRPQQAPQHWGLLQRAEKRWQTSGAAVRRTASDGPTEYGASFGSDLKKRSSRRVVDYWQPPGFLSQHHTAML